MAQEQDLEPGGQYCSLELGSSLHPRTTNIPQDHWRPNWALNRDVQLSTGTQTPAFPLHCRPLQAPVRPGMPSQAAPAPARSGLPCGAAGSPAHPALPGWVQDWFASHLPRGKWGATLLEWIQSCLEGMTVTPQVDKPCQKLLLSSTSPQLTHTISRTRLFQWIFSKQGFFCSKREERKEGVGRSAPGMEPSPAAFLRGAFGTPTRGRGGARSAAAPGVLRSPTPPRPDRALPASLKGDER